MQARRFFVAGAALCDVASRDVVAGTAFCDAAKVLFAQIAMAGTRKCDIPEPPFGTQKLVPLYFCSVQFFMLVSYGEKKRCTSVCVQVVVQKLMHIYRNLFGCIHAWINIS